MPPLKRKQSSGSHNRKKYKKRDELKQSLVGSLDRYVTRATPIEPTLTENVNVTEVNANGDIAGIGEYDNVTVDQTNIGGNLIEVNGDSDDANVVENNDMVGV
ncbi:hypothetical protein MKX03_028736 [Papaver bracteatum]|nr:hypothetical protein MKX03_028736 [Papaver bracteatum]